MNLLHLYKIFCIQLVTWLDNLLRNSNWITSISAHVDTRIPIHYHHHRAPKFVIRMSADGFGMDSPLFQLHEAYAQVRHTGCLVLSSFHRPGRRCVPRRLSAQNRHSSSRLDRWGRGLWACIHHCRCGKPHPSNKVKHSPVWLRWQWRKSGGLGEMEVNLGVWA